MNREDAVVMFQVEIPLVWESFHRITELFSKQGTEPLPGVKPLP